MLGHGGRWLLILCIGLFCSVAKAQDPPDPASEEARQLYAEGTIEYEAANYARAAELFEASFKKAAEIPDQAVRSVVLRDLRFNLARAQIKAYQFDEDRTRLLRARELLQRGLGEGEDPEAVALIEEIDAILSPPNPAEPESACPEGAEARRGRCVASRKSKPPIVWGLDPQPPRWKRATLWSSVAMTGAGAVSAAVLTSLARSGGPVEAGIIDAAQATQDDSQMGSLDTDQPVTGVCEDARAAELPAYGDAIERCNRQDRMRSASYGLWAGTAVAAVSAAVFTILRFSRRAEENPRVTGVPGGMRIRF